jgi:hypothetical protein
MPDRFKVSFSLTEQKMEAFRDASGAFERWSVDVKLATFSERWAWPVMLRQKKPKRDETTAKRLEHHARCPRHQHRLGR